MTDSLHTIFTQKRNEIVKEDFEIGQAAQALFELQKSAKELLAFLQGPFAEGFKKMHNDTRNSEMSYELVKSLKSNKEKFDSVVDEITSYLYDAESGLKPSDRESDMRRKNRWSRWEHRTPRHIQKQEDEY